MVKRTNIRLDALRSPSVVSVSEFSSISGISEMFHKGIIALLLPTITFSVIVVNLNMWNMRTFILGNSNQNETETETIIDLTLQKYFMEVTGRSESEGRLYMDKVIVNPYVYQYLIDPGSSVCKEKSDVLLLIYVYSVSANFKQRTVKRNSWGQLNHTHISRTRIIFILGQPGNPSEQTGIQQESDQFGDIVQADFLDTYRNLTLKGFTALKWISSYCAQAKFVSKIDDDTFVNTFELVAYFDNVIKANFGLKRTFFC